MNGCTDWPELTLLLGAVGLMLLGFVTLLSWVLRWVR